jgi:MtfA peptidase
MLFIFHLMRSLLESFFEKPAEFKGYHPDFYQALVFLVKQDP